MTREEWEWTLDGRMDGWMLEWGNYGDSNVDVSGRDEM